MGLGCSRHLLYVTVSSFIRPLSLLTWLGFDLIFSLLDRRYRRSEAEVSINRVWITRFTSWTKALGCTCTRKPKWIRLKRWFDSSGASAVWWWTWNMSRSWYPFGIKAWNSPNLSMTPPFTWTSPSSWCLENPLIIMTSSLAGNMVSWQEKKQGYSWQPGFMRQLKD